LALGAGVIIPPWNFSLAILCGRSVAALVTGNTIVIKPSSETPTVAAIFAGTLLEAGFPPESFSFLPGSGSAVGDVLVEHPKTRFVSFTGSRDVGLRINELAARPQKGQIWIKRIVAEMGGKDAIIVDERVYDAFLEKLKARAEKIRTGSPEDPQYYMGPVISAGAKKSILGYIEIGRTEGDLLIGGGDVPAEGHYIPPTIIANVDSKARVFQEEIFGPVLAVAKARDFEHALALANDSPYGLTGAIYSRNAQHLERAREEFFVGNMYINRKCTGAMVGSHPFGGFHM